MKFVENQMGGAVTHLASRIVALLVCLAVGNPAIAATSIPIPAETPIYLITDKEIIAKRRNYDVGDTIPVKVWRDVIVQGIAVIKADTPATLRVESIKGRSVVGISGKVSFGAVETTAIDGQTINLGGGYNKKGAGRIALSATLGALIFWPALFIPGGVPRFPSGTVFDAYSDGSYRIELTGKERRIIQLGGTNRFTALVDYDTLMATEKPKYFDFILIDTGDSQEFVIDSVNGESIKPLPIKILSADDDRLRAQVEIKKLSKKFQRGINRFDIAYTDDAGDRVASEVILEIEF